MTAFAFPNLDGGGVGTDVSLSGGKIIQRISRPHLSELLKESRMADADEELVLQTQSGSPAAFESLIRNHQRMIHSLTFRMTGSLADAEDLRGRRSSAPTRRSVRFAARRNFPPGFIASPSTPA